LSLIWWLIIINVAVVVHELAHYLAARAQGVRVKAFSVGMGPILARREWRGTEWRLSAVPIGGYVDIEGLAATPGPDGQLIAPDSGMARLPYLGKIAILAAGPLANVLLAIVLLSSILTLQGLPQPLPGPAVLQSVVVNSAAEKAGFQRGDTIVAIDGRTVTGFEDVRQALRQDGTHVFTVEREGQKLDLRTTWAPTTPPGGTRPLFGVAFAPPAVRYDRLPVTRAIAESSATLAAAVPATIGAFGKGIVETFSFSDPRSGNPENQVMGPVGTVNAVGDFARQGWAGLFTFAALINVSLGIFNLMPIPGLDGGRILLSTVIAIRRQPFRPGQEEFINFLGFAFVLAFIVLVTFRDVVRLAG
jgi:regulator of sigma E protease